MSKIICNVTTCDYNDFGYCTKSGRPKSVNGRCTQMSFFEILRALSELCE